MTQPRQEAGWKEELVILLGILAVFGGLLTGIWYLNQAKHQQPAWDHPVEKGSAICFLVGPVGDGTDRQVRKCTLAEHTCFLVESPSSLTGTGWSCVKSGAPIPIEEERS